MGVQVKQITQPNPEARSQGASWHRGIGCQPSSQFVGLGTSPVSKTHQSPSNVGIYRNHQHVQDARTLIHVYNPFGAFHHSYVFSYSSPSAVQGSDLGLLLSLCLFMPFHAFRSHLLLMTSRSIFLTISPKSLLGYPSGILH